MKRTDVRLCSRLVFPFFFSGKYTYRKLVKDLHYLEETYSDCVRLTSLATTADHRQVYCLCLGNPDAKQKIIVQAAMHAREWLNAPLLLYMIQQLCLELSGNGKHSVGLRETFSRVCFYLIPMANPDGITISQYGWNGIQDIALRQNVKRIANGKKAYCKRWKANARGIDLNRNFATGFAANTLLFENGQEYAGKAPLSEAEAQALHDLVCQVHPCAVINYHETGELIYYEKARQPAILLHSLTGYPLCRLADSPNGNFGDWLSQKNIDWCTVETCLGNAPVSSRQFFSLCKKHREVLQALAEWYG